MTRHGTESLRPGFWLQCDVCSTWTWLRVSAWCERVWGCPCCYEKKRSGVFQIHHATAPKGMLTTWNEKESHNR